ncbi:MAG: 30S ribosomal protein S6 [Chloroflexi bacterium]|nr:30S ribosomal protein S6 [Chloroflexota bacterium]
MNDYELVTIINPEVDGQAVPGVVEKVSHFITDRDGVVQGTEQWGRKRFAYPIKRFFEGNYVFTRFRLDSGRVKEVEEDLRAAQEVLRYLAVKVGD